MQSVKSKIGLVLGCGGARGWAYIGVLRTLVEEKIPIDLIVGLSVGSLIGACYTAGGDENMLKRMIPYTKWRNILDFGFFRKGICGGEKLERFVKLAIGKKDFSELKTPLAILATEAKSGKEVILSNGSVPKAVRASCATPGLFSPVKIDGKLLIDGGVVRSNPVNIARRMGANIVIVVSFKGTTDIFWGTRRTFARMFQKDKKTEFSGADIFIQPELNGIGFWDLDKMEECIAKGQEAARDSLSEIKRLLKELEEKD